LKIKSVTIPDESKPFFELKLYLCIPYNILYITSNLQVSENLIIIPTYREKENIGQIIRAIFNQETDFDVLVIDDNSMDGTAEMVKSLSSEFPEKLHLIERSGKMGLGTAYITGFKYALSKNYKFIFEMDADFSHSPNDLVPLLNACKQDGIGMSVGSRYKKGVAIVNWPLGRLLLSYYASTYVRLITGMSIRDLTAGYVCYRREVLEKLNLDRIRMIGYGFQIEMKFKVWKLGYGIYEIPVIFINREQGTSKMSGGIFSEALFGVIRMKLSSLRKNYIKHIASK
jgi:dolichol-phosphate mannosyltransferase